MKTTIIFITGLLVSGQAWAGSGSQSNRFAKLDPKSGAALSHTEILVNFKVLTMLADVVAQYQLSEIEGGAVY